MDVTERILTGIGIGVASILIYVSGNHNGFDSGRKFGREDSKPVYSRKRDVNADGVEDLILTDGDDKKVVLFGIPENLKDYIQSDAPYTNIDKLRTALRNRASASSLAKESNDYLKGLEKSLEEVNKEK